MEGRLTDEQMLRILEDSDSEEEIMKILDQEEDKEDEDREVGPEIKNPSTELHDQMPAPVVISQSLDEHSVVSHTITGHKPSDILSLTYGFDAGAAAKSAQEHQMR
ncbi:unnamed protein product [Euphydryas editha]|uniref:Uncharacterized protein n=1 Tax=Euphydryas editha TaxID=104508 RepID=A0AAU9UYY4_EUPED|nr:unnamed protein product [Euphydryas editha]